MTCFAAPVNVKVKVWTSTEVNGYIFVWHHVLDEPPSWQLKPVPEIESNKWAYCGRADYSFYAHPQVILIFYTKFFLSFLKLKHRKY